MQLLFDLKKKVTFKTVTATLWEEIMTWQSPFLAMSARDSHSSEEVRPQFPDFFRQNSPPPLPGCQSAGGARVCTRDLQISHAPVVIVGIFSIA